MDVSLFIERLGVGLFVGCWVASTYMLLKYITTSGTDNEELWERMSKRFGWLDQTAIALTVCLGMMAVASYVRGSFWIPVLTGFPFILTILGWANRLRGTWRHRHCTEDHCVHEGEDEPAEEE